ncbi:hypothetical protein L211DRAFT_130387 [Terfezia boudieri ATCC MYA-4762]|uniref:Uncharacterized protein n=1 Tax=Terfezia boudieri ATCC MYA-4762 TaxID=1051890 RepID=A0A3N4LPT1_9PEZI|nr:hypothetical protein L211DRAFT_130387 [Terfezia boudieri ATCC MYA-4762]
MIMNSKVHVCAWSINLDLYPAPVFGVRMILVLVYGTLRLYWSVLEFDDALARGIWIVKYVDMEICINHVLNNYPSAVPTRLQVLMSLSGHPPLISIVL